MRYDQTGRNATGGEPGSQWIDAHGLSPRRYIPTLHEPSSGLRSYRLANAIVINGLNRFLRYDGMSFNRFSWFADVARCENAGLPPEYLGRRARH
jgi:hypothetical protein